ncbi:hypothetical protein J162_03088 [Xanthomonas citri pv. citri]|nr:hypothetical protein J162_03088 [Xanthomonas citri pv. citri]
MVSRSRNSPTRMMSGSSRSAERSGFVEAVRVAVHLALVDQALLRGVDEFDRVLDGEDVPVLILVDVVDHAGQRGRLARAGRAGHQDQALRLIDQLTEDRRAAKVFQRQHFGRNGTEHRTGAAVLVERIDAKTRQRRNFERKVDFEEFLVIAPLLVRHDVVHQRVHLFVVQRRNIDAADIAIDTDHRRQPCRQVQVRCLVLDRKRQ